MKKEEYFTQKIIKKCGRTINRYELIKADESIAVALSGGKDSLSLLDILAGRLAHLPVSYRLTVIHIQARGLTDNIDIEALREFSLQRADRFLSDSFVFDPRDEKDPCFVCSWHRRKRLFSLCKEHNIKKLALGHTLDDIAETLLMNMFYQGNISTMPVSLSLFDGDLTIIRPLADITNDEIVEYARIRQMPIQQSTCTFGKIQSRHRMRELLTDLAKETPQIRKTLVKSMSNIHEDYIF